jgi:hypothetical protein
MFTDNVAYLRLNLAAGNCISGDLFSGIHQTTQALLSETGVSLHFLVFHPSEMLVPVHTAWTSIDRPYFEIPELIAAGVAGLCSA